MPNAVPTGGGRTVQNTQGGSPPHRDVPRPPATKPVTAPSLHVGQTGRQLGQAQRQSRQAVTGQLSGIYANLNKTMGRQYAKAGRQEGRVLASLANQNQKGLSFAHQLVRSARGGLIPGAAVAAIRPAAGVSRATAAASGKQAKQTVAATKGELKGTQVAAGRAQKQSKSITDVITAENKGANIQYVEGLRQQQAALNMQAQQQNAQFQHDFQMAQYNAQVAAQQAQQNADIAKKAAIFQEKLTTGQVGPAAFAAVKPVVSGFLSAVPAILSYMQKNPQATPTDISNYLGPNGIGVFSSTADASNPATMRLIYNITHDTQAGLDSWSQDAVDAIRSIPQWSTMGQGKKDHLLELIRKQLDAQQKQQVADAARQQHDDGGGGINLGGFGVGADTEGGTGLGLTVRVPEAVINALPLPWLRK